ncbi:MAG TPA: DUF1571 domain-containing protein [Gemmataceae bacterium]|nr:DUF1571 domain-containing protein [Gemmataceae bacterium]
MVGSTHRRQIMAAMVVFLAGCVGLGDSPSSMMTDNRPRPRPQRAAEPSTPDLRIPDNAVAQAGSDIPLVPVPPPPFPRSDKTGGTPVPPAKTTGGTPVPPAQASPEKKTGETPVPPAQVPPAAQQPDGTTQTPPHTARQLLEQAAARCATLDSYIVRLTRRENRKGTLGPEEIIAFSFRKKPFSIHFKWLGKTAEGREVVYVKDRFGNKIHTKVAQGDSLLLPAGARLSLSPDNPLVRSASRHPITDAGVCHCVQALTALLDAQERGDRRKGTLTAIAPQRRPEYPQPVETLEYLIAPGVEPELPRGGRRLIYFDPENHLPMLVVTYDDKSNEVEYYRYDRLIAPANLDDDDFNPDKLWPPQSPQRQREDGPR